MQFRGVSIIWGFEDRPCAPWQSSRQGLGDFRIPLAFCAPSYAVSQLREILLSGGGRSGCQEGAARPAEGELQAIQGLQDPGREGRRRWRPEAQAARSCIVWP